MMIEIFSKERKKIAILENAFNISETLKLNSINIFRFSLPDTDPKNIYCKQFNYVRYNGGELYRIMPTNGEFNETGTMSYECEHVISLLIDTVLFGFHQVGGKDLPTPKAIKYVLSKQNDWVLDECDFAKEYEYGWEQENILGALFSIPQPFTDIEYNPDGTVKSMEKTKYIWKFNTQNYPYKISLKRIDESKQSDHHVRKGHNQLTLIKQSDPRQICTRIYPLGAGEGVNQLNIERVNNGIPYIQSTPDIIVKYGIIERVWVDRAYTDAESLLQAARSMLAKLQEPYAEYETSFIGDCRVGDIVQIVDGIKSFIVEIDKSHSEIPETRIKIANKPQEIADTVAELADRQRIESTYSQGATQIYSDSIADNADSKTPLELRFFIPETMLNINSVNVKIRLSQFRGYTDNTEGGSGNLTTTQGGGGATTLSGGAINVTSGSGGGTSQTTGLSTNVKYTDSHLTFASGEPLHNHAIPSWVTSHGHNVTIPNHQHTVTSSAHTHSMPVHSHAIRAQDLIHTHIIKPKITLFSSNYKSFELRINGVTKEYINSTDAELDITKHLVKDLKIPRGVWHTIGILPNDIARVEVSYNITGFIQSRGGATV